MYYLFSVSEVNETFRTEKFESFDYKDQAYSKLMYLLDTLSKKENSNITQPTMNEKDRFHLYSDGKFKKTFIIVRGLKSNELSAKIEASEKVLGSKYFTI